MYQIHPSTRLCDLFRSIPYQGVKPHDARFLFVGLDANYAPNIEQSAIFQDVLSYHQDAVAYWKSKNIHHPFLAPSYRGCGLKYHRNFAQIGFSSEEADTVSFIELLHLPSTGRSDLEPEDLSDQHLLFLRSAIFHGRFKHVFISNKVLSLMQFTGYFPEIRNGYSSDLLPTIYHGPNCLIHRHLHFSVYGKFEEKRRAQAHAISALRSMG